MFNAICTFKTTIVPMANMSGKYIWTFDKGMSETSVSVKRSAVNGFWPLTSDGDPTLGVYHDLSFYFLYRT